MDAKPDLERDPGPEDEARQDVTAVRVAPEQVGRVRVPEALEAVVRRHRVELGEVRVGEGQHAGEDGRQDPDGANAHCNPETPAELLPDRPPRRRREPFGRGRGSAAAGVFGHEEGVVWRRMGSSEAPAENRPRDVKLFWHGAPSGR